MMSRLHFYHGDNSSSSSSLGDEPQPQTSIVTINSSEYLVSEILSRLPVKTLLRFRCVSKLWCSIIDSPHFVKAHLKRSIESSTNAGLVIRGDDFHLVDFDSLEHSIPVEIDEPLKTTLYGCSIVSSCNGLHCLFNPMSDIFLWNPATKKYRKLPAAPADFYCSFGFGGRGSSFCGFGYDAANDDYKFMRIQRDDLLSAGSSKVIVFGLKSNSWTRLKNISYDFQYFGVWGVFMGGALHWITGPDAILAIDIGGESHREIPMPKIRNRITVHELDMITFEESLCILEYRFFVSVDVWVMNDYGVASSWCKLFCVEQPKVISSFVCVTPIAYSKSRDDVLLEVDNNRVMWYNLKRKEIRIAQIANLPRVFDQERGIAPFFYLNVYTESLVPLDYNQGSDRKQLLKQPEKKKKRQQKQKRDERDKFLAKGFNLVL